MRNRKTILTSGSVGHKGRFGHEYLQFEFKPDGKLRYTNNSNYKKDGQIHKELYVNEIVLKELRKIIEDSEIMKYYFNNILTKAEKMMQNGQKQIQSWAAKN